MFVLSPTLAITNPVLVHRFSGNGNIFTRSSIWKLLHVLYIMFFLVPKLLCDLSPNFVKIIQS